MNDHFATIVHRDRMATYRAEADRERILAKTSMKRPGRVPPSAAHSWLASVARALLVTLGWPRVG